MAFALAQRTEDQERALSTLADGRLSRDGGLLTERAVADATRTASPATS